MVASPKSEPQNNQISVLCLCRILLRNSVSARGLVIKAKKKKQQIRRQKQTRWEEGKLIESDRKTACSDATPTQILSTSVCLCRYLRNNKNKKTKWLSAPAIKHVATHQTHTEAFGRLMVVSSPTDDVNCLDFAISSRSTHAQARWHREEYGCDVEANY